MTEARWQRQRGLSLVELMIAMLLGLIVLLAVSQIFVGNRQTFALTEASSEVQESGRIALQLLSRAVRNADYWGCLEGPDAVDSILDVSDPDSPYQFDRGVTAVQNNTVGTDMRADSAVLSLVGINSSITAPLSDSQESGHLNGATGVDFTTLFQGGEILVATNCEFADIFQVSSVQASELTYSASSTMIPGNVRGNLNNAEGNYRNGRVQPVTGERYFVRVLDDGRPALMYQRLNTRNSGGGDYLDANELVAGVERMAIQLGIDSNGNGEIDRWDDLRDSGDATAESHADEALGLRVSLLVSSRTDQVTETPVSYCFPAWGDCGESGSDRETASDRRLYRVYSTSMGIRNRLPD
ncbi:MAG: PilW family protein [Oleiphilaceae bacterium]|nr:PilW family protein [Oleiphilaceae bacterium]